MRQGRRRDYWSRQVAAWRRSGQSKEVIRYGVTTEFSERAIGRALQVSRSAVTKYLECFRRSDLTWEQAQELPNSELLTVLEGHARRGQTRAMSNWPNGFG